MKFVFALVLMLMAITLSRAADSDSNKLDRLCANGDLEACWLLGLSYHKIGVNAESLRLFKKACYSGFPRACVEVMDIYTNSSDGGQQSEGYIDNLETIVEYDNKCSDGIESACRKIHNSYMKLAFHIMFAGARNKDNKERKSEKEYSEMGWIKYAEKTCALNKFAGSPCETLASQYIAGEYGYVKDLSRALEILEDQCWYADLPSSCLSAGGIREQGLENKDATFDDVRAMLDVYKKGCSHNKRNGLACYALGAIYANPNYKYANTILAIAQIESGGKTELSRDEIARGYFQRACRSGVGCEEYVKLKK